jgi:exopolyphosphatase/guanosine-5'-triphosphate,3'-diphosphate pyrophosphatase
VRLVVYAGAPRAREPIYNEKVLAGLGKNGAGETLNAKARARAIRALKRFRRLLDDMKVRTIRCVATAAVRDASDGAEFVREVRAMGLPCRILGDNDEARLAGLGVLYGIPNAKGIAADLGGGSLELVEVADGQTGIGLSMPLGVLRADPSSGGRKAAARMIRRAVRDSGIDVAGKKLYLVGGSWRALARIDMLLTHYPLPITHGYKMNPKRARELAKVTASMDPAWAAVAPPPRHATAPVAAMILDVLADELEPSALVVSAAGIREGLLYSSLRSSARALDPLIEAARERGSQGIRFGQHGDQLDRWMADLFADDAPRMQRLRLASCLLADVAWQADTAFRAERAIETALHGNWFGIDAKGRVLMAQALSSSFGTSDLPDPRLDELCGEGDLTRAHLWGLAIRLGQRLSGGVGAILNRVPLIVERDGLSLDMSRTDRALASEAVALRLEKLAEAMGVAQFGAAA